MLVATDERASLGYAEDMPNPPTRAPRRRTLQEVIELGTHKSRGAGSAPRERELRKAFLALVHLPPDFEVPAHPHIYAALDLFNEVLGAATAIAAGLDMEPQHELVADYRKLLEKLHRHLLDDGVRRRRFVLRLREGRKRYAEATSALKRSQAALYVVSWARECDPQFATLIKHRSDVEAELARLAKRESPGYEHAARLSCLVGAFGDGPLPKKPDKERAAIRRIAKRFAQAFNE